MDGTTDAALIAALRQNGHDTAANHVRDENLAAQLRDAGHETLAAQLVGGAPAQPEPEPETEPERFVRELKEASDGQWSTP